MTDVDLLCIQIALIVNDDIAAMRRFITDRSWPVKEAKAQWGRVHGQKFS